MSRRERHIQQVVDLTYPGSEFNYVGGEFVQAAAPLINSEYAGIAARMGDRDWRGRSSILTNELRRHDKICGYVYTELDDIEWEHNGFVDYDRSPKAFGYDYFVPEMGVADLNAADFVGADAPPCATLPPGGESATCRSSSATGARPWAQPRCAGKRTLQTVSAPSAA